MRDKVFPAVLHSLYFEIDQLCISAASIAIIPDGWTAPFKSVEYIGLAGLLIDEQFQKKLVIFGLEDVNDGHPAEVVKEKLETIINKLQFDKTKIRCKFF